MFYFLENESHFLSFIGQFYFAPEELRRCFALRLNCTLEHHPIIFLIVGRESRFWSSVVFPSISPMILLVVLVPELYGDAQIGPRG